MKRIDWKMVTVSVVALLGTVAFVVGFLGREHLLMLLLGNVGAVTVVVIALCAFDIWRSENVAPVLALATIVATSVVLAWQTNEVCPYGVNVVGVVLVAEINVLVQGLILYCLLRFLDWRYRLSVRPSQPRQPREPQPLEKRRTKPWFSECRWITVAITVTMAMLGGLLPPAWRALVWGVAAGCATGLCGVIILTWADSLWVSVALIGGVAMGGGIALGCLTGWGVGSIFFATTIVVGVFGGMANLLCPPGSERWVIDL